MDKLLSSIASISKKHLLISVVSIAVIGVGAEWSLRSSQNRGSVSEATKIWVPPPVPVSAMPRLSENALRAPNAGPSASVESIGVDDLVKVLTNGMPPEVDTQGLAEAMVENPELREDWREFKKKELGAPPDEKAFLASLMRKSEFQSLAAKFGSSPGSQAFLRAAPALSQDRTAGSRAVQPAAQNASSRFTVASLGRRGQRLLNGGTGKRQSIVGGGLNGWGTAGGAGPGASFTAQNAGADASIGGGFGQGVAARAVGPSGGAADKLPGSGSANSGRGGGGAGRGKVDESYSWTGEGGACYAALPLEDQRAAFNCIKQSPRGSLKTVATQDECCALISNCSQLKACLEKAGVVTPTRTGVSWWSCQSDTFAYNDGRCYRNVPAGRELICCRRESNQSCPAGKKAKDWWNESCSCSPTQTPASTCNASQLANDRSGQ